MDTEGLDSLERDQNIDTQLFALSVLFSSLLIFNTVGAIDENNINLLSLITHIIKIT